MPKQSASRRCLTFITCTLLLCFFGACVRANYVGGKFWYGANLGNVNVFPFQGSPVSHSAAEVQRIVQSTISELAGTGANALRVWFHIDGSRSPAWDPTRPGVVKSPNWAAVNDLKIILKTCHERGIKVLLSLWSHDILAVRRFNSVANRDRVIKMITDSTLTKQYINTAVIPLVKHFKGTVMYTKGTTKYRYSDALIGYEIFNEPEGVSWETRLYHNYMYTVVDSTYEYENPASFDPDTSRRSVDHRSVGFLKAKGLMLKEKPGQSWRALFKGPYFLAGSAEKGTSSPSCPPKPPKAYSDTPDKPPHWYWFNDYMYWDVLTKYNSEFDFLVQQITSCKLKTVDIPTWRIQRFVNAVAAAIHKTDPSAKVTVGGHSIPYTTDAKVLKGAIPDFEANPRNIYSLRAMKAAFGSTPGFDPKGYLDFYSPHGYPHWGKKASSRMFSPFTNPKSKWEVSEPLLIGEFWTIKIDGEDLTAADLVGLRNNGYAGGLGWALLEVKEEPGGSSKARRTIVKHETRDTFLRLFRETTKLLKRG